MTDNPFRIHSPAAGPFFTDRADELARIARSLAEPATKLLVYGPRRMGKTSVLGVALGRLARRGVPGFLADLSKASSPSDMALRVLDAATRAVGRRWTDVVTELARRLTGVATWSADAASGVLVPRLEIGVRRAGVEDQRKTLGEVLDTLDALARARRTHVAVVLDEFQEIHRFGGEAAEWHLRSVVQHHQHLSYVFAGSRESLIRQMLGPNRAFYQLCDPLAIGPIPPEHLARWVDERMRTAGVRPAGAGERCVTVAGLRTRDVVRVARVCFDACRATGRAEPADVDRAFLDLVAEEDDGLQAHWSSLTSHQQDVLRAVAGASDALTGAATREQFALGSSSAVSQTLAAFVEDGHLVRTEGGAGYAYDSPFARAWVVRYALPDIGLRLDPLPPAGTPLPVVKERPAVRYAKRTRRKRG